MLRLYRQSAELPRNTMFNHVRFFWSLRRVAKILPGRKWNVALPAISSLALWLTMHVVHPPTSVLRFFTFDLRDLFQSLNIRGRITITFIPRPLDANSWNVRGKTYAHVAVSQRSIGKIWSYLVEMDVRALFFRPFLGQQWRNDRSLSCELKS